MTELRRFRATDLLKFNNINLDPFTETYSLSFYLSYALNWPSLYTTVYDVSKNEQLMGYCMGKVEGEGLNWHGHITAITIAPSYRRLGLASAMMKDFENACSQIHKAYFVDLFVRPSNKLAVQMYEKLGYKIFQTMVAYYHDDTPGKTEDGLDMRKRLM